MLILLLLKRLLDGSLFLLFSNVRSMAIHADLIDKSKRSKKKQKKQKKKRKKNL